MLTAITILAQQTASPTAGQFMADPFVQGVVLGVAATALFAFILVTLTNRRAADAAPMPIAAAQPAAAPATPAAAPASAAVSVPAARNPVESFAGIDPTHLVIIAAAATAALGGAPRIKRVTRVLAAQPNSAWTEAGRLGLQTSHNVRR